jgi:hypothetical protein
MNSVPFEVTSKSLEATILESEHQSTQKVIFVPPVLMAAAPLFSSSLQSERSFALGVTTGVSRALDR